MRSPPSELPSDSAPSAPAVTTRPTPANDTKMPTIFVGVSVSVPSGTEMSATMTGVAAMRSAESPAVICVSPSVQHAW